MSRLVSLFLTAMLLLAAPVAFAAAPAKKAPPAAKAASTKADPFPTSARAYLTRVGGTTVWAHQADQKLPPASLTKVMTALLVLERADLNAIVTVKPTIVEETGTKLNLRPGDQLLVRDLLAAMLIESDNDAARALAEHVAGAENRFVALMNQRAVQLGMKNTRYTNCAGHHDPNHYSTANDLVLVTETALAKPVFRELVAKAGAEIATIDGQRRFKLETSNKLLPKYAGMQGVKTGYTPQAGRCLIALAERDGVEVLIVLLRAKDRWNLATKMLDSAFERYAYRSNDQKAVVAKR